jgi:hypothetical protein
VAPASPTTIIVTGRRPKPESLDRTVDGFILDHTKKSPRLDQVVRWREPVCPLVRNAPADFIDFVTTRIRTVAQGVGAPIAAPGDTPTCKPNVEVIFTDQPQAMMDTVAQKKPALLGYHFVHQTEQVSRVVKPVQAWYVTATSNGMVTFADDPYQMMPGGSAGSRLSVGLKAVFDHILIVVDTDKVIGQRLGAVADYVALLALAQPATEGDCAPLPSVLDLFSDTCPTADKPQALTAADQAYLEGLYAMDMVAIGSLQRSEIAHHMIDSLKGQ